MKIIQKQKPYMTSFEFGANQLEYSFTMKRNVQGGAVPYQDIPPLWRFQLKKVWAEKYIALGVALFGAVTIADMIPNIPFYPDIPGVGGRQDYTTAIYFAAFGFIFVSILIYVLQMVGRPPALTVIKGSPEIRIIQDDQHGAIAAEIRRRRIDALRQRVAFTDPFGTPLGEARKFRWLLENDVITEQEFSEFMGQLTGQPSSIVAVDKGKTLH